MGIGVLQIDDEFLIKLFTNGIHSYSIKDAIPEGARLIDLHMYPSFNDPGAKPYILLKFWQDSVVNEEKPPSVMLPEYKPTLFKPVIECH